MKRLLLAAVILGLILTVLNFAGFFSPGLNPDGYRGSVVRVTWLNALDTPVSLIRDGEPDHAFGFDLPHRRQEYRDISVSVDDRWTSIHARREDQRERYLVRNERILEIVPLAD